MGIGTPDIGVLSMTFELQQNLMEQLEEVILAVMAAGIPAHMIEMKPMVSRVQGFQAYLEGGIQIVGEL